MKHSIKIVIDRIEGSKAVLRTDDGQTLLWPKEELPVDTKEGSVLFLTLIKNINEQQTQESLAKNLLNALVNKN